MRYFFEQGIKKGSIKQKGVLPLYQTMQLELKNETKPNKRSNFGSVFKIITKKNVRENCITRCTKTTLSDLH